MTRQTTAAAAEFDRTRRLRMSLQTALLIGLSMLFVATIPGCGGCIEDPIAKKKREDEEAKKKDQERKKEKPKDDFTAGRLQVEPHDVSENLNYVKVGHWMAAHQALKANNFDFRGELDSAPVNRGGEPWDLKNTAFRLRLSRPVVLPKGQNKRLETLYYIPPPSETPLADGQPPSKVVWMQSKLRSRQGGREVLPPEMTPTTTLPNYTYFFLVLAADPNQYGYLQRLDSFRPPTDSDADQSLDEIFHYRLVRPETDGAVAVPSQALTWTTIAYLLWDGFNPNQLTPDQQHALVDWLHWGGQLIVNGPSSLDSLKGSFLEPYLPATGGSAIGLEPPAFVELNAKWSLYNNRLKLPQNLVVDAARPLVGVQFVKHPEAELVEGTGGLVAERAVGSGRIAVTAFSLVDRAVLNWGSFDNFFNGCLLRRPARQFVPTQQTEYPVMEWRELSGVRAAIADARFISRVRYFSRDSGVTSSDPRWPVPPSGQSDVAAWNDTSGIANSARDSLKDAAGISIPKSEFVLRVLAVYLLVLVPVNWFVFWLLGRLEWAWVAAPLIAVVGAIAVVRLAQLDIGFARSRTEIAVLEVQGGYPRGHATRYTALYTSLSSGYDLFFDDPSALALPFPNQIPFQRGIHENASTVHFRRDKQVSLSGFQVASNTTGMVHSEHMHDLGGAIRLSGDDDAGWRLLNDSDLDLADAGVLRKDGRGQLQAAWVGNLGGKQAVRLDFQPIANPYLENWRSQATTLSYETERDDFLKKFDADNNKTITVNEVAADASLAGEFAEIDVNRDGRLDPGELLKRVIERRDSQLTLGRLFSLAAQHPLQNGDVRLLGWTERELPGLIIRPAAAQNLTKTLAIVHLRHGPLPKPQSDANLRGEFEEPKDETSESNSEMTDDFPDALGPR